MNKILTDLQKMCVIPVVVLDDVKDALPLAKALCDGGVACAEVTFRTEAAAQCIKIMSDNFPDMLIGAGTVLTTKQVDEAVEAGAKFIISPGLNPKIVEYCTKKNICVIPGVTSPSQIEQTLELGLEVVKFFPAEAAGGLPMIKAMSAPYTNMKFMPTGGINIKNINEYLAFDKIIGCGGSWMVSSDLVKNGNFEEITNLTKEAVMKVLGFELAHVGINCENEKEANETTDVFDSMFGFKKKIGNTSVFAGTFIESMKEPYLGANGHIAIATKSLARAMHYLEGKGYTFDLSTAKYKDGKMIAIYVNVVTSGFAIHLLERK